MKSLKPSKSELRMIDSLVTHYVSDQEIFNRLASSLANLCNSTELKPYIHSVKTRVKDPNHLRFKLIRKLMNAKKDRRRFPYTKDNLFQKVNDLAGVRILHLHTQQFHEINRVLKELLELERYKIIEGPIAKTWDDESRDYFQQYRIKTEKSSSMYTSVHYVVKASNNVTGEIQVRTLAEELWGEVDHAINYPEETHNLSCMEQIRVLARVTSSCSRLVDAIFKTFKDVKP